MKFSMSTRMRASLTSCPYHVNGGVQGNLFALLLVFLTVRFPFLEALQPPAHRQLPSFFASIKGMTKAGVVSVGYSTSTKGSLPRRGDKYQPLHNLHPNSPRGLQSTTSSDVKEISLENFSPNGEEGGGSDSPLQFRLVPFDLIQAAAVGITTGVSVALFKLSIGAVQKVLYQQSILATVPQLLVAIPTLGGILVGSLLALGGGAFPPGLRGTVKEVGADSAGPTQNFVARLGSQIGFLRKSAAAAFTLGTGCSLGPEGPCVEIGMNVARVYMDIGPDLRTKWELITRGHRSWHWNRLLLSCGAAAGVAAGFNAPIAGVFFTLEVMQDAYSAVTREDEQAKEYTMSNSLESATANITPVLLASVLSALTSRALLGNHLVLVLKQYSLKTPLIELPIYLLLGSISGFVAFLFSRAAQFSRAFFAGEVGDDGLRSFFAGRLPAPVKPVMGGLVCGLVGLTFPQILFFGYETLNSLLANASLPTSLLLSLLLVKTVTTAVSAGSGLVGGTFAPALFLGAMTGASFHNALSVLLSCATQLLGSAAVLELADVPAYAMVGAASVLAALFRAPLTASLLLFELTRDYDVILPLMVSAGFGSIVSDILDDSLARRTEQQRQQQQQQHQHQQQQQDIIGLARRDQDAVSWGDLSDQVVKEEED